MADKINSVEDLQRELLKAVWKNESLRQEVMKDPKGSIRNILGVQLPDNLKVKVIDQTEEDVIYLVLPHHPNNIYGFELTEEQIDKVAGGAITPLSSQLLSSAMRYQRMGMGLSSKLLSSTLGYQKMYTQQ